VRILVVDDDAALRDSLERTLRFDGHAVAKARDRLEVVAVYLYRAAGRRSAEALSVKVELDTP
jgi:DNA-binding response OmpR family regulator